jgi:glycosyltransferase involved in cell wall biosynthesis
MSARDISAGREPTRSDVTRPLRLLVLSQHFWPESFRINSFVEALLEAGAEVTVLTGQPNYPEGRIFSGYRATGMGREGHPAGYDIVRVPLLPRGRAGHARLAANYLSYVLSAGLLGPVQLRGKEFDAIFVYATSPVFQALAVWVQDLWPNALAGTGYVRNRRLLKMVERGVGVVYRGSDLLLGQSRAFVEAIRPLAGRVPVEYLPNPGEPVGGQPGPAETSLLPDRFNLVFAGNLGRAQALDGVIEAARLLRDRSDIAIWLFGSGAMQDELASAVAAGGLANVHLPGRVAPEQIGAILAQADAALLTLVDDPMLAKTVPSKLQTYFAAGLPVVVGAGGEAARITLEADAGSVAPPADPAALARAISAMADLPAAERVAMGERAEHYHAQHFAPDKLARWLVERLWRLVDDNGGGRRG